MERGGTGDQRLETANWRLRLEEGERKLSHLPVRYYPVLGPPESGKAVPPGRDENWQNARCVDQHAVGVLPGTVPVDSPAQFARGLHPPLGTKTQTKTPKRKGPTWKKGKLMTKDVNPA